MDDAVRSAERALDGSGESLARLAVVRWRAGTARPATAYVCASCGDVLCSVLAEQGTSVGLEGEEFVDSCGACGEAVVFVLVCM